MAVLLPYSHPLAVWWVQQGWFLAGCNPHIRLRFVLLLLGLGFYFVLFWFCLCICLDVVFKALELRELM